VIPLNQVKGTAVLKTLARRGHRFLTSSRKASLILVYHRIAEPLVDPWALCVSPECFAEQLEVLQNIADLVPLDVIVAARSDRELPERPVAITFDDGYADNLTHAVPILENSRVPATIFVTTGFLDVTHEVWSDELARLILHSAEDPMRLTSPLNLVLENGRRFMGGGEPWYAWQQPRELRQWIYRTLYDRMLRADDETRKDVLDIVRRWCGRRPGELEKPRFLKSAELAKLALSRGIEIGAHSLTHPVLATLSSMQQTHEISRSKEVIEVLTGKPVRSFAYPYGKKHHFNADTVSAVQSAGLSCGCANYGRLVTQKTSRWALPRYQVLNWNANAFTKEINQWYRG
jgi:peptidoglycan/xylan/chitin deacetylase (PgdA/CDA1 family)